MRMFSVGGAVSQGWQIFKENKGFLVVVHVVALLIQTVPQLLFDGPGVRAAVILASMLLSFVVALGLVRIGMNLVDGEPADFGNLFGFAHLVFKYLLASILHGLLIVAGLILLFVPGLIWIAQFSQWPFLMVEHEMGPIEAMKTSSRLTRGTRGRLVLFYFVVFGLFILGFLALGVGVVVSYAVVTVASAHVYREILAHQPDDLKAST
jgi:uncharacterized membrane protein